MQVELPRPQDGAYPPVAKSEGSASIAFNEADLLSPYPILAFTPVPVREMLDAWPHSAVVLDPAGEAWEATSDMRSDPRRNVFHFDPLNDDQSLVAAYNPLAEIRLRSKYDVGDAQNIAASLTDPHGHGVNDHWARASRSFLPGAMLHYCYWSRQATLAGFAEFVASMARADTLSKYLEIMIVSSHLGDSPHPAVVHEARTLIGMDERERLSVVSSALSFLTLYRDPVVTANIAESAWTMDDIVNADKPTTVYLAGQPDSAERVLPIIRLVTSLAVHKLTGTMSFANGKHAAQHKHRVLLVLNDFADLRRMPEVEKALPYMHLYGIKAVMAIQSEIMGAYCHVVGQPEDVADKR